MFGGHFEESKQKDVKLNEISATCFDNVLEFVYRSKVTINEKNSYDLLTASRFFDLVDLEELCVRFMEENLSGERIFQTCTFAGLIGKTKLYEKCMAYVAENFIELTKEEAFLEVPYDFLEAVLKHEALQRIDDVMLDFIIQWKDNNSVEKDKVRKLLSYVNAAGITRDYLTKLVLQDDDVKGTCLNVYVRRDLNDTKHVIDEYTYRNSNQKWICKKDYCRDNFSVKNALIGNHVFTLKCIGSNLEAREMNEFRRRKRTCDEYQVLKNPPIGVSEFALSAVHNTLYLYKYRAETAQETIYESGTYVKVRNEEISKQLFNYVYDLDEWFNVPKPKIETSFSSVASLNNLLYLIGGSNSKTCDSSEKGYAQCYDHRSPCWIRLPNMLCNDENVAACIFDGKLYVHGGWSKALEVFDPVAGRWQNLRCSAYNRTFHCMVNYGGAVWAIGSRVEIPLEMYHANWNAWKVSERLQETADKHSRIIDAFVC